MTASVGDLLAFSALPDEVRDICLRAYGCTPEEVPEPTEGEEDDDRLECDGECDVATKLRDALDDIGAILARLDA